jgi:hypothetical protein
VMGGVSSGIKITLGPAGGSLPPAHTAANGTHWRARKVQKNLTRATYGSWQWISSGFE